MIKRTETVPAFTLKHVDVPPGEYWPALQPTQLLAPAADEYVPAGHDTHVVCAVKLWYCPAAQFVQPPAQLAEEYWPVGQLLHPFAWPPGAQ